MSELLPCPFCGCEAEIITTESIHGGYLFGIMCKYCCSRGDFHHTEEQAIDAWNSRVKRYPESLAQRMIADGYEYELFELRKECDKLKELNSRAERTCKLDYERHCSNCGVYVHASAVLVRKDLDGGTWTVVSKPVSYCPNCGCKVINDVEGK